MGPEALHRAAGALIVGGFAEAELAEPVARDLAEGRLAGVILMRRNVVDLEQVVRLNTAIHAARPSDDPPPIISVDQEGGRVARLRGLTTDLPPMAVLGAIGNPDLSAKAGEMVGEELSSLGFNLDYAPVMDVHTEPNNPVIGDRAFSSDADVVSRIAGAFAAGLLIGGVAPCAKHFPGHGDTTIDSHVDLPVIPHGRERLSAVEWVPFRAAARAELPMIMTAHVLVPAFDTEHPATFSPAILEGVLRRLLRYRGVIVSDDLEMAAVAGRYDMAEMAERGVMAGVDLFLVCHSRERQAELFEALVRLGELGGPPAERLQAAAARVGAFRRDFLGSGGAPDLEAARGVVRCPAHRALTERIGERFAQIQSARRD